MNVIGHDDELMQKKLSRVAVVRKRINQEPGGRSAAEDRLSMCRDRCNKEEAIGVHSVILTARQREDQ